MDDKVVHIKKYKKIILRISCKNLNMTQQLNLLLLSFKVVILVRCKTILFFEPRSILLVHKNIC